MIDDIEVDSRGRPARAPGASGSGDLAEAIGPQGRWMFQHFGEHILKITFVPLGAARLEQVSDAVVLAPSGEPVIIERAHPLHAGWAPGAEVRADGQGYLLRIGGTELGLLGYHETDEYRGFRFALRPAEMLTGTGERAIPLNRRGRRLPLYNAAEYEYQLGTDNLHYSVPIVLSSRGYALYFDNPSKGYLDLGKTDERVLEYGGCSGELSFYLIVGASCDDILRRFSALVGRQPMPARWALGHLMSRFGYRSEIQVRGILERMAVQDLPVDAVLFDLFWFGDGLQGTMGNLDWVSRSTWPDPPRMIADFKREGIHTVLITEPYVVNASRQWESSLPYQAVDGDGRPFLVTALYFGHAGILDIFRRDTQDWFWAFHRRQIENGVAGFWGDLGEPERHPDGVHHDLRARGFSRRFSANEVHNIYNHCWIRMMAERYAEEYPETRLFALHRSGFAGSPRYGVLPWTGDVRRSWLGLQAQLPVLLGTSLSGVPYIHSDAGGFAGGEKDPELYTRWVQFAVFTPVLRPHGLALDDTESTVVDGNALRNIPPEPVFYPEPYLSIVSRYIRLRYAFTPYNYTMAYEQAVNGKALLRPMFYHDCADENLWAAEDQYLWGDSVLVAPVLQRGQTTRWLYLPHGRWMDFHSRQLVDGERWMEVSVGIEDIPLYVKAGAVLVLSNHRGNMAGYRGDDLTALCVPGEGAFAGEIYDDDGLANGAWEDGRHERISFTGTVHPRGGSIHLGSSGEGWSGRPAARRIMLEIADVVACPSAVYVNGAPAVESGYDAPSRVLRIPVRYADRALEVSWVV